MLTQLHVTILMGNISGHPLCPLWYSTAQPILLPTYFPNPSTFLAFSVALIMPSTPSHSNLLVFVAGVVTITYFLARKMFGHDSREPPLAPQSVPLIGHMIGMSRSKFNYYVDLRYGQAIGHLVSSFAR